MMVYVKITSDINTQYNIELYMFLHFVVLFINIYDHIVYSFVVFVWFLYVSYKFMVNINNNNMYDDDLFCACPSVCI